jgi:hypothetical protein
MSYQDTPVSTAITNENDNHFGDGGQLVRHDRRPEQVPA